MRLRRTSHAGKSGGTVALSRDSAQTLVDEIERLRAEVSSLEARVTELDELAYKDALVGLPNRRCFFRDLEQLIH